MKVVINVCYGGFSLSTRGVQRLAELQGRECYFYVHPRKADGGIDFDRQVRVTREEAEDAFSWSAFDIPDAETKLFGRYSNTEWHAASPEQRQAWNQEYDRHQIENRELSRHDPLLVRVVEELGGEHRQGASGAHAELRIVEIPEGVDYEIDEYDGMEHIAEKHRTWG